jgi:peptide/nickel transport system substrate-binding protein
MNDREQQERIQRLVDWVRANRISRRDFIRQSAALGLSGSVIATVLAACGDDDDDDDDGADDTPTATTGAGGDATVAEDEPTEAEDEGDATEPEAEATEPEEEGGEDEGEHPQGGEIIIGTLGEAQSINPFLTNETEGQWRSNMLYDQFVFIDPQTYEVQPKLAREWTASDDATEFSFTLQDGILFSDGTPLTTADISFFFHGVLQPESTSPFVARFIAIAGAQEYNDGSADTISGIEVIDETQIKLTLAEPNAAFLVNLEHVRPVPMALLEGKSLSDDAFFQEPIGAGPFKFVSWQTGGDFVAERNENYWQPGKPYLDRFVHRTIADSQTLVLALETGEIDASNYPAPTVAENLQSIDTLDVIVPPFTQPDGWSFNLEHEALAKMEVRKAITHALNMEQYAADFLLGLGGVGVGPLAPDNWAFNTELEPIPYDLDLAKELMAEAGYPDGGFSVAFTTNQGNILREDFLTFTQAALTELGIDAVSNLSEWTQVVDAATNGTFEAICPTWSGAVVEPDELYLTLHSESARNVYHYSNAEVDQLLEDARGEVDQDLRREMYWRVQEILMEEVPIFWAWYRPFIHVTNNRFGGYVDSNLTGGLFVGLENWYVKE